MAKSILDLKGLPPVQGPVAPPRPVYRPKPAWCKFDWGVPLDEGGAFQLGDRRSVRISAEDYRALDPTAVIDAGEDENGEHYALLWAQSWLPTSAMTFREMYEDVWSYEKTFGLWRVKGGEVIDEPTAVAERPADWQVDPLYLFYMVNAIDLFCDYSDDYRVSSGGNAHKDQVHALCRRVRQQCTAEGQIDAWIAFFVACYNAMVSDTTREPEYQIDAERAHKYWFKLA